MKVETLALLHLCATEYNNTSVAAGSSLIRWSSSSITKGHERKNTPDDDESDMEWNLEEIDNELSLLILRESKRDDRCAKEDYDSRVRKKGRNMIWCVWCIRIQLYLSVYLILSITCHGIETTSLIHVRIKRNGVEYSVSDLECHMMHFWIY